MHTPTGSRDMACAPLLSAVALFQDWAAQRCTISYRAPELFSVQSHCVIDERTDVWVRSMWLGTWEEKGVALYYYGGKGRRYLVSVA